MLKARHFLRLPLWRSLKKEIVCSLAKYKEELLQQVAQSGQRELAGLAAQLTGRLGGNG